MDVLADTVNCENLESTAQANSEDELDYEVSPPATLTNIEMIEDDTDTSNNSSRIEDTQPISVEASTDAETSNDSSNIGDTASISVKTSTDADELNELSDDVQVQDSTGKKTKFTLLLNEEADLSEIEEALYRMYPTVTLTIIKEIKLVQIVSDERIDEEKIMSNEIIKAATSVCGSLVDFEQEEGTLTDIYTGSKSTTLENVQGKITLNTEERKSLSSLAWYVDEVTESKKSLDISTGENIAIALIDSGVDYLHPLLADKIDLKHAKSYIPDEATLVRTESHGTMVAGVIAQIAPKAKITPYRVLLERAGNSLWIIEAILQATKDGKDIINMSLYAYKNTNDESEYLTVKAFERAVQYAMSRGVILVSAAGNDGLNLDSIYTENSIRILPGSLEGVLSITSTTKNRELSSYSNYGSNVKFAAPGGDKILVNGVIDLSEQIYTTSPLSTNTGLSVGIPQGYTYSYGTSLSAPAVTAGIASFMSYYKAMTGERAARDIVMEYFQNSALDLGAAGYDKYFGYGQINIYKALSLVEDKIPPSGEMISLTLESQTKVNAEDLVINVSDNKDAPTDVKIYFETTYDPGKLGSQEIVIVLEDSSNNKTYLSGKITMIDTAPLKGKVQKATTFQGETPKAEQLVYDIQDNAGTAQVIVQLVTDIDTSKVGIYPGTISLKNQSGNETLIESDVEIVVRLEQPKTEPETKLEMEPDSVVKPKVKAIAPKTRDENEIYLLIGIMVMNVLIAGIICSKKNHRSNRT